MSPASLAPSRKKDIAGGAFRAMIAGTVACFMTACVAGIVTLHTTIYVSVSLIGRRFPSPTCAPHHYGIIVQISASPLCERALSPQGASFRRKEKWKEIQKLGKETYKMKFFLTKGNSIQFGIIYLMS